MTIFTGTASIRDVNEKYSDVTWILQDITDVDLGAEFNTAVTRINTLATNYAALTDGVLAEVAIRYVLSADGSTPVAGNVYEYANCVAALNAPGQPRKTGQVNIFAPTIGMMQGTTGQDRNRVNLSHAALQTYVTNLSSWVTISDGEIINTASGTNGLYSGVRIVKSRKLANRA